MAGTSPAMTDEELPLLLPLFPRTLGERISRMSNPFNRSAPYHGQGTLRVFSEMKEHKSYLWTRSIGAMSSGTKSEFPALQAVDLISYWFYKTEMEKLSEV